MRQLIQIYLVLLLFTGVSGCSTIGYYGQAIHGHLSLVMAGEPVAVVSRNADTPQELKHKLYTAIRARGFARRQLGLPVGDAFTDYVALDRPWVVVNLVAVPEFSLEPHRWCYPVLGCQAYRGYFSLEPARREQARFRNEGFDTFIGGVTAYSTLGWFDDPLHTGFTDLSEDRMVALMFHELAHRVVYLAGDTAFNESFATAVELEGLRLWLERQGNPEDFARALRRLEFRNRTLALVQETAGKLEQLYQRRDSLPVQTLRARKARQLSRLASAYEALARQYREPGPFGPAPVTLNNAHLALFRQYHQHVPAFRQLLRETGYDFEAFYRQVIRLSEQSPSARKARLSELSHRFDEHL